MGKVLRFVKFGTVYQSRDHGRRRSAAPCEQSLLNVIVITFVLRIQALCSEALPGPEARRSIDEVSLRMVRLSH